MYLHITACFRVPTHFHVLKSVDIALFLNICGWVPIVILITNNLSWSNILKPLSTLWRHVREGEVEIHSFLTSGSNGDEWSISQPDCFTPGEKNSGTHGTGVWVGPRASLDFMDKRKILAPTYSESGNLFPNSDWATWPTGIMLYFFYYK